jgi:hypothetical protein
VNLPRGSGRTFPRNVSRLDLATLFELSTILPLWESLLHFHEAPTPAVRMRSLKDRSMRAPSWVRPYSPHRIFFDQKICASEILTPLAHAKTPSGGSIREKDFFPEPSVAQRSGRAGRITGHQWLYANYRRKAVNPSAAYQSFRSGQEGRDRRMTRTSQKSVALLPMRFPIASSGKHDQLDVKISL